MDVVICEYFRNENVIYEEEYFGFLLIFIELDGLFLFFILVVFSVEK